MYVANKIGTEESFEFEWSSIDEFFIFKDDKKELADSKEYEIVEVDDKPNTKFSFHLGNVQVETNNINELREYVEEIQTKKGAGEDLSKHLSDFCFDVESTYQRFHKLGPDDWSIVHNKS